MDATQRVRGGRWGGNAGRPTPATRTNRRALIVSRVAPLTPQFAVSPGGSHQWSDSGEYLYYSGFENSETGEDLYRRRAETGEEAEELLARPLNQQVDDIAPGDSLVVVWESTADRGADLLLMRHGADGVELEDLLVADWSDWGGTVSPDGRWMAYVSTQGGESRLASKIWVQSFPVPGGAHQVSPERGDDPLWGPSGRMLYYRSRDQIMGVAVTTEPSFSVSAPRRLFDRSDYRFGPGRDWDIHPDGSRFVLVKRRDATQENLAPLVLVTNWFTELRERMGGG